MEISTASLRFSFPVTVLATLATAVVALLLLPAPARGTVDFETIEHPAFVGMGPGPDGFVGTADDVPDPENTSGTVACGISIAGILLYPGDPIADEEADLLKRAGARVAVRFHGIEGSSPPHRRPGGAPS